MFNACARRVQPPTPSIALWAERSIVFHRIWINAAWFSSSNRARILIDKLCGEQVYDERAKRSISTTTAKLSLFVWIGRMGVKREFVVVHFNRRFITRWVSLVMPHFRFTNFNDIETGVCDCWVRDWHTNSWVTAMCWGRLAVWLNPYGGCFRSVRQNSMRPLKARNYKRFLSRHGVSVS